MLFLANGHGRNLDMFEASINAMQPQGARLREIRIYDLSLPEERFYEFVKTITCNQKHSRKQLSRLQRFGRFIGLLLGYKPVALDLSRFPDEPENRLVKTVIIGTKPDPRKESGEEVI